MPPLPSTSRSASPKWSASSVASANTNLEPRAVTSQLRQTLSLRDLIFIVVGTVIGSGIWLTPGSVVRNSGSGGLALIVWLVGGVLSLLGALTFAEMAASRPDSGGLYVYLRDAFGPLLAFLYGWTMFLVIGCGSL